MSVSQRATGELVVAVCQVAPRIGDRSANLALVEGRVREAAAAGAGLVVLPELVTTGYVLEPEELRRCAEPADGPTARVLRALAEELDLVVVAGMAEAAGDPRGSIYNTALLVDATGLRAAYRKVHLWDREPELFAVGGRRPPVVDTAVGRVGVMVCYDLEFPEWIRAAAADGAELVCAPTNWPLTSRPTGERPVEVVRAQAAASLNRVFLATADRVGPERGTSWVGGSAVLGPDGYPLALAEPDGTEQLLLAHCDLARARDKQSGPRNHVFDDRRPHLYDAVPPNREHAP